MVTRPSLCIDNFDDHAVVALSGEFDLDVADSLRDALAVALQSRRHVVVDLADTSFMDSVSLGCLVMAAKTARATGGWVRVAAPQRTILRVLRLTGLDTVLAVHDTVQGATTGGAQPNPGLVDA